MLQACNLLLEKMRGSFSKNFDTFEAYVRRNIFTLPQPEPSSSSSAAAPSSSDKYSTTPSPADLSQQLLQLSDEIKSIRSRYLNLQQEHLRLLNECSDNDKLLKDMRNALFHLRVGAQVLDEHNIQPLDEAVRNMVDQKDQLIAYSQRAAELNAQIRSGLHLDIQKDGTFLVITLFEHYWMILLKQVTILRILEPVPLKICNIYRGCSRMSEIIHRTSITLNM